MTGPGAIGVRRFDMADQMRFAHATGDVNPMHIDPLAARRTQAGVCVVHGINAMLWAIDRWLEAGGDRPILGLAAQFDRFIEVDAEIALTARAKGDTTRLELRAGDSKLATVTLRHTARNAAPPEPLAAGAIAPIPASPRVLDFGDVTHGAGAMAVRGVDALYPRLATLFGPARLAGLAGLSTLVGMVLPGLHSIFSSLDVAFTEQAPAGDAIAYRVRSAHELFRLVDVAVDGAGFSGAIKAFVRLPPVRQPTTGELAPLFAPGELSGISALVIGGSRGLGEVTAKLLAAAGARVAISYAVGAVEAEAVRDDIRGHGGACEIIRFDARQPAAAQLAALPFAIDQLYYFATSRIFLQKGDLYDPAAFETFRAIYVDGFADLCAALATPGRALSAFYPSSVAVEERPRAMTEYAMAKAAGEILCADIDRFAPGVGIVMRRLPRLLTDQTATVTPVDTPSSVDTMLEVVRAMAGHMAAPAA